MNFSTFDPRYMPSSGFDNSTLNDDIDAGMQWPPKVEDTPIDESFLQGVLPDLLTIREHSTISCEHYWHDLLKQFPFLISLALNSCMLSENELKEAKEYQVKSEDSDDEKGALSDAHSALTSAQDSLRELYKAKSYMALVLKQFDPKLNPAAYFEAKDGTIIKGTALQCDFNINGIKLFNTELQTRDYFYSKYTCIQELFSHGSSLRAVTHKGLLNLRLWIEQSIMSAQGIVREYQHLDN